MNYVSAEKQLDWHERKFVLCFQIDRSFELAIDKNEKITRLYASKDIDDDTFEKGKAVVSHWLEIL